jgi:hypothetical protein
MILCDLQQVDAFLLVCASKTDFTKLLCFLTIKGVNIMGIKSDQHQKWYSYIGFSVYSGFLN